MKTVAVFGSTGSIGAQTLNVVRRFPHEYKIVALAAGSNLAALSAQITEFAPERISASAECAIPRGIAGFFGSDSAERLAAECDADIFVMAVSGLAALPPLMRILKKGKRVALANKEAIVCAGDMVLAAAEKYGSEIIPVDSEHSAVFQCLAAGRREDVEKITLTASGGPFYARRDVDLSAVTPEMALMHPTWNMGAKISIDSATMVNKGLEIIEARRLFGCCEVDYVVHPESVIHSLVEFSDHSAIALMSYPNMELAIQYALTYPARMPNDGVKAFDYRKSLTFLPPDEKRFPAPALARECLRIGGTAPAIFSIADEIAVELFLQKRLKFTEITGIIGDALSINEIENDFSYEDLIVLERKIREFTVKKFS